MRLLILLLIVVTTTLLHGQTKSDSVNMGANYVNMAYYSMANGELTGGDAVSWDLQISTTITSASIRINDGANVELYQLQNQDTASWMTADTSGMTQLYNSDSTYEKGAFNVQGPAHPDYGWGTYTGMGNLVGSRIFAIKTGDGMYRKVWVKELAAGVVYKIRVASLDNAEDTTITVDKTAYSDKSFIYYSLMTKSVLDIEPNSADWDLVFRRYVTEISLGGPPQPYRVSGVLTHPDVTTAEARGVNTNIDTDQGYTYTNHITNIGDDWKSFNRTTNVYDMVEQLVYFVAAQDSNFYKIVFTGFGGQANGKAYFNTTKLEKASTGISASDIIEQWTVYPNPAKEAVNALIMLKESTKLEINVFNLAGKSVYHQDYAGNHGLNQVVLDIDNIAPGFYLLSISNQGVHLTTKFVKTN